MCQNWSGSVWVSASLMAQTMKHLPAMWETHIRSLGQEDPLEQGIATHSSTLAWKIPWTEEPGRYSPWGRKKSDKTERLHFLSFTSLPSHWVMLGK